MLYILGPLSELNSQWKMAIRLLFESKATLPSKNISSSSCVFFVPFPPYEFGLFRGLENLEKIRFATNLRRNISCIDYVPTNKLVGKSGVYNFDLLDLTVSLQKQISKILLVQIFKLSPSRPFAQRQSVQT